MEQYERDDNVQALLRAIHDAFDFAHHEDALLIQSIKPQSEQARILILMLQDVCTCCDFIQSYAKDSQFCTYLHLFYWLLQTCYFREAYVKEYRQRARGKDQGAVRWPCQSPKGLFGPRYPLYGDYCVPNSRQRGKNIDSAFRPR